MIKESIGPIRASYATDEAWLIARAAFLKDQMEKAEEKSIANPYIREFPSALDFDAHMQHNTEALAALQEFVDAHSKWCKCSIELSKLDVETV